MARNAQPEKGGWGSGLVLPFGHDLAGNASGVSSWLACWLWVCFSFHFDCPGQRQNLVGNLGCTP